LQGGVDLWSSGARANGNVSAGEAMDWENDSIQAVSGSTNVSALPTGKQSICDGLFEIVAVFGSWHLGQLTVGLSRAVRLRQGRKLLIRTSESLPMQVDGEPFMQSAGEVLVEHRGHARILRRVENKPVAAVVRVVEEVLEDAASSGVISQQQHNTLSTQLAARLHSS
jgi:diacylglycerol kinase (ATP)